LLTRDTQGQPSLVPPETLYPLARYLLALAQTDPDVDVRDRARLLRALIERAGVLPQLSGSQASTTNGFADEDEDAWRAGESVAVYGAHEDESGLPSGVVLRKEQVRHILRSGKVVPAETPLWTITRASSSCLDFHTLTIDEHCAKTDPEAVMGSLTLLTGRSMGAEHSRVLPEWPDEPTDSGIREVAEDQRSSTPAFASRGFSGSGGFAGGSGSGSATPAGGWQTASAAPPSPIPGAEPQKKWKDLDDFYADEGKDEEESESEDDESDSGEEDELPGRPTVAVAAVAQVSNDRAIAAVGGPVLSPSPQHESEEEEEEESEEDDEELETDEETDEDADVRTRLLSQS